MCGRGSSRGGGVRRAPRERDGEQEEEEEDDDGVKEEEEGSLPGRGAGDDRHSGHRNTKRANERARPAENE